MAPPSFCSCGPPSTEICPPTSLSLLLPFFSLAPLALLALFRHDLHPPPFPTIHRVSDILDSRGRGLLKKASRLSPPSSLDASAGQFLPKFTLSQPVTLNRLSLLGELVSKGRLGILAVISSFPPSTAVFFSRIHGVASILPSVPLLRALGGGTLCPFSRADAAFLLLTRVLLSMPCYDAHLFLLGRTPCSRDRHSLRLIIVPALFFPSFPPPK